MPVGYRNSSGVDFDSLFDPFVTGTPPANTGFRDSGGVDLAGRYAPIAFGTKGPDVGFRTSGGVDVSNLWAAIGTATYANLDDLPPSLVADGVGVPPGPVTISVGFTLNRNGSLSWTEGSSGSGTWIPGGGATAGDDYDMRVTQTDTNSTGTLSLTNVTLATWQQMNMSRGLTLTATRSGGGGTQLAQRTFLVELRRRSDNVTIASKSVFCSAQATIEA